MSITKKRDLLESIEIAKKGLKREELMVLEKKLVKGEQGKKEMIKGAIIEQSGATAKSD